ncbi:prephenate dehydratase [Phytomonospora endophytica]|uniref:Prephenate dehydratase n=1 Tax=Phytomonospora endophytica TaxID=714109 RepID=A0A841G299_9ACTN|nr:prephenate dehydratase [Phytomonospora endophytica]MBB6038270.1 prephenate dehydratase [Phytomonospora endophytica]GIG64199.1 prephenate dehydratase [Phytomonospora endophytica]
MVTIAYLGPPGTFSEAAVRRLSPAPDEAVPTRSIPEALDAVRDGAVGAALVPLENSLEGSVPVTLDNLLGGPGLRVVGEVALPVTFALAGRGPLESVRTVASHPHALAQCRGFLRAKLPSASTVEVLSTAAAAQAVLDGTVDAAVCAPIAATALGIPLLAENIGDRPDTATRFVLVVPADTPPPAPTGNDVTSLAVYIAHDRVGALLSVLTELAVRGVNLTRIESRPTGERLGRYVFLLDCAGHVADSRMGEALLGLRRVCAEVRFLGSYPRDTDDPPVAAPAGLTDDDLHAAEDWLRGLRGGA